MKTVPWNVSRYVPPGNQTAARFKMTENFDLMHSAGAKNSVVIRAKRLPDVSGQS
jgi:hypothetical protein